MAALQIPRTAADVEQIFSRLNPGAAGVATTERGALNYITAEKRRSAAASVR